MQTFDTSSLARVTTRNQEENLLSYFHRLHLARQVADVQGKKWCRVEARRIKEKVLFLESLEAVV